MFTACELVGIELVDLLFRMQCHQRFMRSCLTMAPFVSSNDRTVSLRSQLQ